VERALTVSTGGLMTRILACCIGIWIVFSTEGLGHGGGLDSLGCHHDRQRGGYHCHQGSLAGRSFSSKEEALWILEASTDSQPSSEPDTTQPGPAVTPAQPPTLPYSRNLYGSWIDEDGDCQNTRQEVLIAESLVPVELNSGGCRVVSGAWLDPFTDRTFTDPGELDIDHFIPLAEAHRSGANSWTPQHRRDFANDLSFPGSLIAVSASANRSKGDRDPADWLPPNQDFHCEYVRTWIIAKAYWGLTMDDVERSTVYLILGECKSSIKGLAY